MSQVNQAILSAREAKAAARILSAVEPARKNAFFLETAKLLEEKKEQILYENNIDIQKASVKGVAPWLIERMRLTETTLQSLEKACWKVAGMDDPIGVIETQWQRPNGLMVGKMRIPIGVIAMIYEARPAVAIEASILAIKAGNAILLRGSRVCANSNGILAEILQLALENSGLPKSAAQMLHGGHDIVSELCKLDQYIDLIIPRGGEELVSEVAAAAKMPVLMHYKGVCHAYIDKGADLRQAIDIIVNSKVSRPAVCNALECLLVQKDEASRFLPVLAQKMLPYDVEFRADSISLPLLGPKATPLKQEDLGREFLGPVLAVCVVKDMDAALEHIARYGSRHTEIICTREYQRAMRFMREVDASMVGVNASTRFNDGGELGLGAEIGISTSKLHSYGPMGVKELTTTKFVVQGNGQIRQ